MVLWFYGFMASRLEGFKVLGWRTFGTPGHSISFEEAVFRKPHTKRSAVWGWRSPPSQRLEEMPPCDCSARVRHTLFGFIFFFVRLCVIQDFCVNLHF